MDMNHKLNKYSFQIDISISFWLPNPYLSASTCRLNDCYLENQSEAHRVSQIKTVQAWTYMAHKLHWTYLSKQIWLISISVQQDLFDQNNTKDKAEETMQSPDGWGRTKVKACILEKA